NSLGRARGPRKAHHEGCRRVAGDVAGEVERAERCVRARRVAQQTTDVAAYLERVASPDEGQVVHELVGLAQVDAFATGVVAKPVEALNVDRRKSDLVLVRRTAIGTADEHAVDTQVFFYAESRQPARAESIQVAAHVPEADLVQNGGTPRRDVLHRHALVVEHARRWKRRVDWDGRIVSS